MRIYIAAPYELRDDAIDYMNILSHREHVITSGWLRDERPNTHLTAQDNLNDIANAQALLAINPLQWERIGTGGRHVELGYALALKKRVIVIGVRSNNFHYLDAVTIVRTLDQAIVILEAL